MFKRLRRGFFVGVALLFTLCLGFATPALAEGETQYRDLGNVKLTAVIVAPIGTDASGDEYVFHFDGDGNVTAGAQEESGKIPVYSDGVEQDNATIKAGDVVPVIGDENGNVTLTGIELTDTNSLTNGDLGQTVVQTPLSGILNGVTFPHAGIYTYEVTQTSATSDTNTAYVTPSQAKYRLRIWVKNAKTEEDSVIGDKSLAIDYVTVQLLKDDDGEQQEKDENQNDITVKVDPTNPTTNEQGMITGISGTNKLAGDGRGRNVPGFTFANEYITIAPLKVKKLYDGNHADRTRYSTVELAVHSSTVMPSGSVLTYKIEGGKDLIEGRSKLDGVSGIDQADHYMAEFDAYGWCYIKADLKEGDSIRITGEFGPLDNGEREILSTNGLYRGQTYYVLENDPGDYRPTGYVYGGSDSYTNEENEVVYIDPRKDYADEQAVWYRAPQVDDSPHTITDQRLEGTSIYNKEHGLNAFALLMIREATGNDTTIFVVNDLDDNKVSPTGIFFDNLPYILMIGVPLVVFAGMFVAKRRGNAA